MSALTSDANTCQLVIPQTEQVTVTAASPSVDQLCGTACHMICGVDILLDTFKNKLNISV